MPLTLLFLVCVATLALGTEDSYFTECPRSGTKDRVMIFLIDGVRADIMEANMGSLPNIARLANAGVTTPCEDVFSPNCARTHMGNRFAPYPIDYTQLGPGDTNASNTNDVVSFLDVYHWLSFSGYGSIASGLDAPHHKIKLQQPIDGVNYYRAVTRSGGSFFRLAKEAHYKSALVATPDVLGSVWTNPDGAPNSLGVVDYECGFDYLTDLPLVQPGDVNSCNLDYRRAITEVEYDTFRDNVARDWMKLMVDRGCAHVNAIHFNTPDSTMHKHGIGSEQYNLSLIYVDDLIGEILAAMETASDQFGYNWLVITTSDHGGRENAEANKIIYGPVSRTLAHDTHWNYDEAIPFIVTGLGNNPPPLRSLQHPIRHFDVFPTVLHYLGVEYDPEAIDGQVQGIEASSAAARFGACLGLVVLAVGFLLG